MKSTNLLNLLYAGGLWPCHNECDSASKLHVNSSWKWEASSSILSKSLDVYVQVGACHKS